MMGISKVVDLLRPCVRGSSEPRCGMSLAVVVFSVAGVVFIEKWDSASDESFVGVWMPRAV